MVIILNTNINNCAKYSNDKSYYYLYVYKLSPSCSNIMTCSGVGSNTLN